MAQRVAVSVGRLDGKRSVETGERCSRALGGEHMFERIAAQQKIIGVARLAQLLTLELGELHARLDRGDHALRDVVLQVEDVAEVAVEPIGPKRPARACIDQLSCDPQAVATAADATFEHMGDVKLTPDLADVYGLATSRTSPTKRLPLRGSVRIRRCALPSSPTAVHDAAGQRGVRDRAAAPDRVKQLLAADDAVAGADEKFQEVEHLRLEWDLLLSAAQLAPAGVQRSKSLK